MLNFHEFSKFLSRTIVSFSANFDAAAHKNTWNQTLLMQYWQTKRPTRSWASNLCDVLKTASSYCSRRITSSQSACMQSTLDILGQLSVSSRTSRHVHHNFQICSKYFFVVFVRQQQALTRMPWPYMIWSRPITPTIQNKTHRWI